MIRPGSKRRSKRARPARPLPHRAETRPRLIEAARSLFADRGFARVTVRDICREASANVAAVSYHFGDKLGLYREVAREAIGQIRRANEVTADTEPDSSPEERLRHYVRTYLPRVAKPSDDNRWIGQLMSHELTDPTPIAAWIFAEAIVPGILYLRDIVATILELDPGDPRVVHCVTSVQAQCLFYRPDAFKTAVAPGWAPSDDAAVAAIADHVIHFSLAGIKAVKKAAAKQQQP